MKLTTEEAILLIDILDTALEAADECKEAMIGDTATFANIDTFIEVMQEHDLTVQRLQAIKRKVIDDA